MGRYKAMTKTVNQFKVKGSRKKLERAARNKKRSELTKALSAGEGIEGTLEKKMEVDGEEQKAKGITKQNEHRLRKHELPFMSASKGSSKKSIANKTLDPTQNFQSSDNIVEVTSNRQFTKKKARKMLRNWNREKRKKDREMNTMEI